MLFIVVNINFYTFLPLLIIPMYVTLVFTAIFIAKIFHFIVNAIHKPKTGLFLRHPSDKDYRYFCIRNVIKRWPFWLSHRFPVRLPRLQLDQVYPVNHLQKNNFALILLLELQHIYSLHRVFDLPW